MLLDVGAAVFGAPSAVARTGDGALVVADPLAAMGVGAVLRVDEGGAHVIASGDPLVSPSGVAVGRHGVLYVADPGARRGLGGVFALASATPGAAVREIAYGGELVNPVALAVGTGAGGNDVVYVADPGAQGVIAIDPASGAQRVVFAGLPLLYPGAIAVVPVCGDGLVEGDEQCDPAAEGVTGTCCDATCRLVAGTGCTITTTTSTPPTTSRTATTTSTIGPGGFVTTTTLPCTTAVCGLEAAETSGACAGQTVSPRLAAKFAKADRLIDRAAKLSPAKAQVLRKKAKGILKRAEGKVSRAAQGRSPKLSSDCAAAIRRATERVIAGLGV